MKTIALGAIASFVRGPFGGSLKKNIFVEDGIAVYEQQHAIYNQFNNIRYFITESKFEEMKRFQVFPNDIIMSCSGTMGKVAIVPKTAKKGIINQALLKITPSKELSSKFLEYYMSSPLFNYYLNADAKGAAIKNVASVKDLKNIPIIKLSISEQQAIVEKLDAAFALIDQAKANIEKNIQNAKELFQSKLNQIFSQKGEGWEEKKINDVSTFKSGTTLSPQIEKKQGEIAYLKVADMNLAENLKGIVNTSSRYVNKVNINTKNIIPRGSIIFPKRGGAILTDKKRFTNIDIVVDLNIMAAIPIKTLIDGRLLFYFFLSFKLSDIANGTTILQINNYSFDEVRINIPKSLETQKEIVSQLDALSEQTKQLEAKYQTKLANLEELRKSILEKAFKGELVQMSESQISTD